MSETFSYDNLFAGNTIPPVAVLGTIAISQGALVRGAAMGKVTLGGATKANAGAGSAGANTGGGALTVDVTTPLLANAQVGVYRIRVQTTGTGTCLFRVYDPKGNYLGDVTAPSSNPTSFSNQIKFAVLSASADYAATDGFTITVAAGDGTVKPLNPANVDGSQYIYGILAEAKADSNATQPCVLYVEGEFNEDALTFAGGTHASYHEAAKELGMYFKDCVGV